MNQLWNIWSYGSKGRTPSDFITHAFEETEGGHMAERTLCGRKIGGSYTWDSGLVMVPQEGTVGCKQCRAKMKKAGIEAQSIPTPAR